MLIARIFPRPYGARKNTTQLAKYPRVLYVKPSNKGFIIPPFLGSFCAAILSLLFSPNVCPVLQCNNVAYFARSFALIW